MSLTPRYLVSLPPFNTTCVQSRIRLQSFDRKHKTPLSLIPRHSLNNPDSHSNELPEEGTPGLFATCSMFIHQLDESRLGCLRSLRSASVGIVGSGTLLPLQPRNSHRRTPPTDRSIFHTWSVDLLHAVICGTCFYARIHEHHRHTPPSRPRPPLPPPSPLMQCPFNASVIDRLTL